jgi:hypothetical protein
VLTAVLAVAAGRSGHAAKANTTTTALTRPPVAAPSVPAPAATTPRILQPTTTSAAPAPSTAPPVATSGGS